MNKLLLGLSAAIGLVYARLFGGPMDGTAWDVKLKADSLFSFSRRETLIFDHGRMTAAEQIGRGFRPAAYNAQGAGDLETIWNASLTHVEEGVMTWHGLVRGDHIEGVAIWWVKKGSPKRFVFSGTRKTG